MTVIDRIRRQSLRDVYFMPSITSGLVGLFQPRRSAADAAVNRAPGGVNATVVGSPAFGAWGAVLGPAAYLETAIPETAAYTIISVVRKNPAGSVAIVSTLAGSVNSTPFAHLVMRVGLPSRFAACAKTTAVSAEKNIGFDFADGNTDFETIFASCDGTSLMEMLPRNPTVVGGNPRIDALSGTRDAPTAPWRIGAPRIVTALYANSTEHALTMIYNRALSELEGRAVYAQAAAYFSVRGVAI